MTITTTSEFLTALLALQKAKAEGGQKSVSSLLAALIEFAAAHPDTVVAFCGSLLDFISSLVASGSSGTTTAEELAAKLDAAVAASQALETATT